MEFIALLYRSTSGLIPPHQEEKSSDMTATVIQVSDEVQDAVRDGRPVVALESTIFTHGLPRPRNLEVALDAEASLRAQGVTPATIGVFNGIPTVGLSLNPPV